MYIRKYSIIIYLFPIILSGFLAFLPETLSAYTLLEPLGETTKVGNNPGEYFATLYKIGVGIAGVLAVLMLVIGGIEYITSIAIGSKEDAKKRMWAAVGGLLLTLLSWLILNTINPNLTDFNATAPTPASTKVPPPPKSNAISG